VNPKVGQMEDLVEAWFALSEEMGKQWSEQTGTKNKDVKNVFQSWTDFSTEMGRGMFDLMGGSSGGYAGVRRTWSEWSDRITQQLSNAKSSSPDMADVRDLQETWARNSVRINKLLAGKMTDSVASQMESFAKVAETAGRTLKPTSGKEAQDMTDLTTTMARYWADNYAKVMQATQTVLEEEGDVPTKSRRITDAWSDFTADMVKEVMRTAAFSRWMGKVRDSDLDVRHQTRNLIEEGLRSMGSPTRSDMEEVQRSLKEIKMELRALKQKKEGRAERKPTTKKGPVKKGKGTKR
jgi:hypothetical protein